MTKKQIAHKNRQSKTTAKLQQKAKQLHQLVQSMTTHRVSSSGGNNPPSYLRQMSLAGVPLLIELYKLGGTVTLANGQFLLQPEPVFTLAVSAPAGVLPLAVLKAGHKLGTMQRWSGQPHDPYLDRATPAQATALDELWRRFPDITWLERGTTIKAMIREAQRMGLADSLLTRGRIAVETGAPPLSLPRFVDQPLPVTFSGQQVERIEQLALLHDKIYSIAGFFQDDLPLLLEVLVWDNTTTGRLLERRTYSVASASHQKRWLANAVADWRDADEI